MPISSSTLTLPPEQTDEEQFRILQSLFKTLGLVDTPPEEDFDKHTRLVCDHILAPVALVSFVQEELDRQFFKSQIGLTGEWAERRQTPLSHSFCQFVKRDNRPLIIEHAPTDARVCDNLAIPDLGVNAYLGVPIHGPDDQAMGALCAVDTKPRSWSQSDVRYMQDVASCVTDQINLRAAQMGASG